MEQDEAGQKVIPAPQWLIDRMEALKKLPPPTLDEVKLSFIMSEKQRKYVDPTTVKLVDLVRDNKKVKFLFYRDAKFYYEQEDGFVFPISLEEANAGRATFLAEDKAIYYMRWMKKYIEECKSAPA